MKYFKYIDVPGWEVLSDKMRQYLLDRGYTNHQPSYDLFDRDVFYHIPELRSVFKNINLTVVNAGLFYLPPNSRSTIHKDDVPSGFCRINLPILNCEGSVTRFYQAPDSAVKKIQQDNRHPYYYVEPTDCNLISSVEIIRPTVLDVSEIHEVINFNNVPRIAATIKFQEDIRYLLD
jgi:hypothetical protein